MAFNQLRCPPRNVDSIQEYQLLQHLPGAWGAGFACRGAVRALRIWQMGQHDYNDYNRQYQSRTEDTAIISITTTFTTMASTEGGLREAEFFCSDHGWASVCKPARHGDSLHHAQWHSSKLAAAAVPAIATAAHN